MGGGIKEGLTKMASNNLFYQELMQIFKDF